MMTTFIHSILFGKNPSDVRDPQGKKRIFSRPSFAFLLLLFLSINGNAQSKFDTTNWRFSNPKQFGFTVMDLDFVDDNNVIAVGTDGGIAKSRDGGATWSYGVFTYVNANGLWFKPTFTDIHYISSTIAYAVGSGITGVASSPFKQGVMVKTTDGGASWSQVNNPLSANQKNAYTCWFVNTNTGYIGGDWNTLDSIPKVYFTNNGGATWDSLVSPSGPQTRFGYVNNPNLPAQTFTVTGKAKEIRRIMFLDENTGYISGTAAHSSFSAPVGLIPNANASTCLPLGTFGSAVLSVSLVWKFSNGSLIDYSTTKERLGYSGVPVGTPITCTSRYVSPGVVSQVFNAMHIINDSAILLISLNNNLVMRVYTGKNDSTVNVATGLKDAGRYEIFNSSNVQSGLPTIPAVNPLFSFQQPREIRKASNGKLFVPVGNAGGNRMMTTVDTGRTWREERNLPTGRTYSNYGPQAIDIAPGGKFLVAGTSGVVADSIPGGTWSSTYVAVPTQGDKVEFADCNNGMVTGSGGSITITTDGGKTWVDKASSAIGGGGFQLFGMAYPTTSKAYFAVNNGIIYSSTDQATTLDPAYTNTSFQMRDVAAIGNDSVWAVGNNTGSIPIATRTSKVFRSFDGGLTWTIHGSFPVGSLNQSFTDIEFPSRQVGYVAGTRDTIWKTTDAGATWSKLPLPTPGNPISISCNDLFALDENTVFLVGVGFGATTRTVVFKTIDGGNTWTDISSNIGVLMGAAIGGSSNNTTVMFHDANNGYVSSGSGSLLKTTNGGTSWTLEYAPTGGFGAMAFAPRKVPPSISFENRKLFLVSLSLGIAPIMEYGNPSNVNVNTTETVVNATCTNLTAGSITLNTTGGLAPYTYSINGGAFQSSNVFNGLTQGAKTITVKDAFCGTLTKTVTVGFTDNLVLTTNRDTAVCASEPVPMLASTNGTGASFAWTPAAGLTNPGISNPVATVTANAAYTVTATLNGCVRSNTVNILIRPKPIISAGPDKTIVDGDQVTLDGTAIAPVFMAWTPGSSLINAFTLKPIAKPSVTTTYTLLVRNGDNCTSTDNMVVTVIPYCIKVMNAFTPNGDGTNDRWIVTNGSACTNSIKVKVFNRYGQEVYNNENYQNNWDGMYGGKPIPDGTYYYIIDFRLINGKSVIVKGDVTILR